MKKGIIIVLCLLSGQIFAQWKSYYPEGKSNTKNVVKQDIEKHNLKYNNCLFEALKAKSLENFDEALKQFQKCIKLDKKQALPFYESALINKNQRHLELAE